MNIDKRSGKRIIEVGILCREKFMTQTYEIILMHWHSLESVL